MLAFSSYRWVRRHVISRCYGYTMEVFVLKRKLIIVGYIYLQKVYPGHIYHAVNLHVSPACAFPNDVDRFATTIYVIFRSKLRNLLEIR